MTSLTAAMMLQVSIVAHQPQTYEAAYRNAIESQRPLVVILGADWCPACRLLKHKTLREVADENGFNGVEVAFVDITRQRRLAKKLLKGSRIPQMVRFDRVGEKWRVKRLNGLHDVTTIRQFAQRKAEEPSHAKAPTHTLRQEDAPTPALVEATR